MSEAVNVTDRRRGPALVFKIAGHLARVALALIFLAAGILKAIDPDEFARQIAGYGIVGPELAHLGAPLLIALEFTLGIALIVGFRPRTTPIIVGVMLLAFIAIEGYGISQGRTEACGCFGAYVQRTPQQVILEDLLFIGLAVVSLWGLRGWSGPARRPATIAVVAGALLSLGFTVASPHLPLEPIVTSLTAGRSIDDLGIAASVPGLERGRHFVALIDVTDDASAETAARLDAIVQSPDAPRVIALTPATEEERLAFTLMTIPEFDLQNIDRPILKRLYRRLPRFFLVDAGKVVAVYDGGVPEPADLLSSEAQ